MFNFCESNFLSTANETHISELAVEVALAALAKTTATFTNWFLPNCYL